ncbi:caspase family protein [Streptomyces sp. NPDC018000]|uniref:HD domain-containing protein n=1 Tax=Streptomyces sp. NPDC018000 TaxID=3365028 RepID=UPI00379EA779
MEWEQGEAAAGRRRALLIGVKDTPYLAKDPDLAARYRPLDFAERDVSLIATALKQSDYSVVVEHEDTGLNPVFGKVSGFLGSCEPGDTAFLYVSCHGETIDGKDHLVLADAQPGPGLPDGSLGLLPGSLLRADASGLLSSLPAGVTAVVCLDICRTNGAAVPVRTGGGWSSGSHDAYWLYSCGAGQRAYADQVEGSWFARALAGALSFTNPPRTFLDVARHTEAELRRIADQHPQAEPPRVETRMPIPPSGAQQSDPVLCEGSRQTLHWARTIRESGLWSHTSGTEATHDRVKDKLTELVHCVVDSCAGSGAHRDDPWSDPLYPARVEARLTSLVARAELPRGERLTPAETACLLAATVVHEGVVAIALDELRGLLPDRFDPGPRHLTEVAGDHRRLVRDAARDVCRAHSMVLRTTETLRGRGPRLRAATTAADHWLRHRFIADWDRLWERTRDYGLVDRLIGMTVAAIEVAADTPVAGTVTAETRQEIDSKVRQVLGHLTVKPGRSPRINLDHADDTWDENWRPVRGNRLRGLQLARLLWTAGLLAADPRRLSSVLVDHLGAHAPLLPSDVVKALGTGFDYEEDEGRTADTYGLTVWFRCPHPALHAAVEELVLDADATVRAFRRDVGSQPLLRGLPDQVTAQQLRALPGRYQEPLERFRLAEDEIRPLLMGTQLYGDRMLAVRELYQNALDACRYRDMRRQYGLTRTPWDGEMTAAQGWEGEITFTQGWDDDRPYIECLDTGAGMTRSKLTSMFARAGKRYEQDPDFVLERRNWRRHGIADRALNSRFGIGVFSYFMLAEEVVVWTHAVDSVGRPGKEKPLRADIQSGSGLLQINRSDDPLVPANGGTRVRLYLAEPRKGEKRPSLVETLRSLLWVTEHRVTAKELTEDGEPARNLSWEPGRLAHRDGWHGSPLPVRGRENPEVFAWLVQGPGQLLLDGVAVRDAPAIEGRVINLRERHSPVPSVDRNQLLSYDEGLALEELLEGVADAVADSKEVSMRWLWKLAEDAPRVAVAVLDGLPPGATAVLNSEEGERLVSGRLQLATAGCFPFDEEAVRSTYSSAQLDSERPHENALFRDWQFTRLGILASQEHFAPAGYPTHNSLDALLFQRDVPPPWVSVLHAAAQAQVPVRVALRALRRYAITGITVPAVDDLRRLGDREVGQPAADLYVGYAAVARQLHPWATDIVSMFRRQSTMLRRSKPPAVHAPILAVSALHDLPLGAVVDLLKELSHLDPTLPKPPELDPLLAQERVTEDEVCRIAIDGDLPATPWMQAPSWLPGEVGPVDLLSRTEPPLTLDVLARRIEQFTALGFSLVHTPTAAALECGALPPDQQLLLSADFDRTPPWREGALPLHHLLRATSELAAPLGEVARRVNAATPVTGAHAPGIPEEAADWLVPYPLPFLMFERQSVSAPSALRPWELVGAFLQRGRDLPELRKAIGALDALGAIDWRGTDRVALERQATTRDSLLTPYPATKTISNSDYISVGGDFDEDGVSLAYALALSVQQGSDLGTMMDLLNEVRTDLPLKVEPLPPSARGLRATAGDLHSLLSGPNDVVHGLVSGTDNSHAARFRAQLTIPDLLRHAEYSLCSLGASVSRLRTFAQVGAPTPPGDPAEPGVPDLNDFTPDRFDHAAFDKGLLGPGVLGPLELVLVAGRFGWDLGRTYARYAPLRCLGLDVTVREPDSREASLLPDWRDVLILTSQLTGRLPALSGEVSRDHIALCAEETDLDETEVIGRLRQYAPLFGLDLPSPAPTVEESQ